VNDKNIIFHVEGGIGKNIMATAVAAAIKKKYPERDIITIG
jgi:AAA+ superfamily predicted ATPase